MPATLQVLKKSQSPVMGTSFQKRGAIGKIDENGATTAAMNLICQHHAKTCLEFWEMRFARLGVDLVRNSGQRFFVFERRSPYRRTHVSIFPKMVVM